MNTDPSILCTKTWYLGFCLHIRNSSLNQRPVAHSYKVNTLYSCVGVHIQHFGKRRTSRHKNSSRQQFVLPLSEEIQGKKMMMVMVFTQYIRNTLSGKRSDTFIDRYSVRNQNCITGHKYLLQLCLITFTL